MFDKFKQSKLFFWSLEILVLATLALVLSKINFLFAPVGTFFSTLFAPVLIAGFLYYLLNPIVVFLMKTTKIKRIYAVILVLLLLVAAIVLTVVSVIPNLINQISQLAENIPTFAKNMETWISKIADGLCATVRKSQSFLWFIAATISKWAVNKFGIDRRNDCFSNDDHCYSTIHLVLYAERRRETCAKYSISFT